MRLNINNEKLNTYSIRDWISHYLGHHSNSEQSVTLVKKRSSTSIFSWKTSKFSGGFPNLHHQQDGPNAHRLTWDFISNEMKYFQSDVFYEFPVTVYMKYPEKPIAGLFQCFYFDRNEISSADKYYVNTNPKWSHPNETSAHASVS